MLIPHYFCSDGVKSVQINGTTWVILQPLSADMTLVGAMSIFFIRKPVLEINWTGLKNPLGIPELNGLLDNIILGILSN